MKISSALKPSGSGLRRHLVLAFSMLVTTECHQLMAQEKKLPQREFSGVEAAKKVQGAEFVKEGTEHAYPSFVKLSPSVKVSPATIKTWWKQTLKMNPAVDFNLVSSRKDQGGMEHSRFRQTYLGIPIDNSEYIAHFRNGSLQTFNGLAVEIKTQQNANARLSEKQALDMGLKNDDASTYKWENQALMDDLKKRKGDRNATYYPNGLLCWLVSKDHASLRLVYKFDVEAANPDKFFRMYVDANTGAIVKTLPLESNCDGATVNTIFNGNQNISTEKYTGTLWRLRDDCKSAVFHVRDWNSANCTESPQEIDNTTNTWTTMNERFGATVLWLCNQSYNYWNDVRGLDSYDDGGGDIDGYINAMFDGDGSTSGCQPTANNASMSFTGGRLKVGLSSAGTLTNSYATVDIIGHEFAHAVTGASAGLDYQDESGALNESFSDIFGEANEQYVFGSNDWLIGEERDNGALRDMSDPKDFGHPDTYLGTNWATGTGDNGGVHTNSGVQNYWFYLLTTGGSGTNDNGDTYSVSGIGLTKASAIAASNLLNYLSSTSQYSDARTNSIQAAVDLYGACSNEVKQTTNAWYAVGVGAQYFDATVTITSNYNGRQVSCHDACDATATVNVISGFTPTYNWSTGSTSSTETGICPGNHSVTVTNLLGFGCSVTVPFTVENTPLLTVTPTATSNFNGYNVSCFGGSNGTAAANAAGGTPPYTYSWSNGQTSSTATGLSAILYSVTVTDANGCSSGGNVTLTEPPLLTTTAAPTSDYNGYNVRCHGGSDGVAEAYPTGGVPPYTYSWSNGQTTKVATGLMAQSYSVTVTDANGCTAGATTVELTEPPQLTIDAGPNKIVYLGFPDSACTDLTYSGQGGGVPPYTITWSTGSTANTITVCPDTTTIYTVTILDANGCSFTDSVKVCVIDVRCGNNLDKVVICHATGSNSNPYQTLCISIVAAQNHFIQHPEDQLAACGTVKVCTDSSAAPIAMAFANVPETIEKGNAYLQAYPNPFAITTTLRFMHTDNEKVQLILYDMAGKQMVKLFDAKVEANRVYNITLDATRLRSGVYFADLKTAGGKNIARKLIVTK
ncbi:MAG: M4 family metallopeptidase [Bacteroidota bacterium]